MKPFTYKYSQPEEYHFSLDSIELPFYLSKKLQFLHDDINVLDLCAGCGVMGLELSFYFPQLKNIDFVEVQKVYEKEFNENIAITKSQQKNFRLLLMNYEELLNEKFKNKYDLILCNPPYFRLGQGKLSPSDFKNRCRFFIDSSLQKLIEVITFTMCKNGQAFLLLRPLQEHGWDLIKEVNDLVVSNQHQMELLDDIRGTKLVKITSLC